MVKGGVVPEDSSEALRQQSPLHPCTFGTDALTHLQHCLVHKSDFELDPLLGLLLTQESQ